MTEIVKSEQQWEEELTLRFPILRFFSWRHLPAPLQDTSQDFAAVAFSFAARVPHVPGDHSPEARARGAEATVALRKLLEAKDAAVRAMLP